MIYQRVAFPKKVKHRLEELELFFGGGTTGLPFEHEYRPDFHVHRQNYHLL